MSVIVSCINIDVPRCVEDKESDRGEYQYHSKVQLLPGGLSQAPGIQRSCSHESVSPVFRCAGHQQLTVVCSPDPGIINVILKLLPVLSGNSD